MTPDNACGAPKEGDAVMTNRYAPELTFAQEMVAHLQHYLRPDWADWGRMQLWKIELASPPDDLPPTIRLEYLRDSERHVDNVAHLGFDASPWGEAELWMGVTFAHYAERGLT